MPAKRLSLATVAWGLCAAATVAADSRMPSFTAAGLVNAASGQTVLAPYSICSLYGTGLLLNGAVTATGHNEMPYSLAGVTVLFGTIPAGLFYVSPSQINLLVPNSLTPGSYSITIIRDGLASQPVAVNLQEVAPGLFASPPGFAMALHADGRSVSESSPARPGEVVVFYGTGLGRTDPDPADREIASSAGVIVHFADFQFLVDGVAIDAVRVEYAGVAPSSAGLYQVNVRLPDNLPATNPEIRISVAGAVSPPGVRLITGPISVAP